MESLGGAGAASSQPPVALSADKEQLNYECNSGQIWVKTMDDQEMLFKFYDPNIKEEKDEKKIKDE